MKLLFKNTTEYNQDLYLKFCEFHNEKFGLRYEIVTLLIIALFLYCIILGIQNKAFHLVAIFLIMLIMYVFWRFFKPVFNFKKEIKSKKITKHQKFTFCFYKYFFKIIHNNKMDYAFYFMIKKIYETEDVYYLYTDKTHALLLDKNSFKIGTSEEFSKFLKRKLWYKYRKVKKFS